MRGWGGVGAWYVVKNYDQLVSSWLPIVMRPEYHLDNPHPPPPPPHHRYTLIVCLDPTAKCSDSGHFAGKSSLDPKIPFATPYYSS